MNNSSIPAASKHGVTVVAITCPEELPPGAIRLAIEKDIINGEQHVGINYPDKAASSLWTGASDEIRELRHLYQKEFRSKHPAVSVISMGDSEGNWLQGPGYHAVAKHPDGTNGLVTFIQETDGLPPVESANIGKLREVAKACGCHIVIFLIAQGKFNPVSIKGMVDRLIVVEPCEADSDWEYAVSITQIRQGYFSPSPGKLFCQFNQVTDAFPEVTWEPFIDTDPEIRAQWHMHQKGCSMAEIAQAFGCDKSTVSRNLKRTPKKLESWLTEDELDELATTILGDNPPSQKPPQEDNCIKANAINDEDDCDWDNLDDDDEDEVPKQQAMHKKSRW